jgi:hypothetical protein
MSTNLMLESLITARSEQNFMQMYRCPDYIDNNKKHEIQMPSDGNTSHDTFEFDLTRIQKLKKLVSSKF